MSLPAPSLKQLSVRFQDPAVVHKIFVTTFASCVEGVVKYEPVLLTQSLHCKILLYKSPATNNAAVIGMYRYAGVTVQVWC